MVRFLQGAVSKEELQKPLSPRRPLRQLHPRASAAISSISIQPVISPTAVPPSPQTTESPLPLDPKEIEKMLASDRTDQIPQMPNMTRYLAVGFLFLVFFAGIGMAMYLFMHRQGLNSRMEPPPMNVPSGQPWPPPASAPQIQPQQSPANIPGNQPAPPPVSAPNPSQEQPPVNISEWNTQPVQPPVDNSNLNRSSLSSE